MTESEQGAFEDRLRSQIDAYHEAALLYAAVRLGLPDGLAAGRATAEHLAAALGLSAPHLHRLLRGLCSIGICEELAGGAFALAHGGHALKSGSASRLAEKVQIVVGQYWQPWANLEANLKTGDPAFEQVFGTDIGEWRRINSRQGAAFETYLAAETLAQSRALLKALDLAKVALLAEIGGGYGGFLAAGLQAHSRMAGILFERPHILANAKPFLEARGLEGRVAFVAGDLLAEIPVKADLYVLKGVLQQWDDAEAGAILANIRKAMPDGARLVIIERLLPERATDDPAAIMLDLHMMAIAGGRARSLAAFTELLSEASLTLVKATPTDPGLSVLEAAPR